MTLNTRTVARALTRIAIAALLAPLMVGHVFADITTFPTDGTGNDPTNAWKAYTEKTVFAWDQMPQIYLITDYGFKVPPFGTDSQSFHQLWTAPGSTPSVSNMLMSNTGPMNPLNYWNMFGIAWQDVRTPGQWTVESFFNYNGTGDIYTARVQYAVSTFTVLGEHVAAIPEPETYAMLMAGLGLMGFVARRRKQTGA